MSERYDEHERFLWTIFIIIIVGLVSALFISFLLTNISLIHNKSCLEKAAKIYCGYLNQEYDGLNNIHMEPRFECRPLRKSEPELYTFTDKELERCKK